MAADRRPRPETLGAPNFGRGEVVLGAPSDGDQLPAAGQPRSASRSRM